MRGRSVAWAVLVAAMAAVAGGPEHEGKDGAAWIEQLSNGDASARAKAAEALGAIGADVDKAIPSLQRTAKDKDAAVREAAGAALERILGEVTWRGRRDPKERDRLLSRGGGGKATEEAVLEALGWLARHQEEDGSWHAQGFAKRCKGSSCGGVGMEAHASGLTGLAVLALLGAGTVPDPSAQAAGGASPGFALAKGIAWIASRQGKDGRIADDGDAKPMYGHAIATAALCEAYGQTQDEALRPKAEAAVRWLVDAQNPGAAWRYTPKCSDNDTSVTGWCIAALKAAGMAGIKVPPHVLTSAYGWLLGNTEPKVLQVGYEHRDQAGVLVVVPGKNENYANHPAMTAAGMTIRMVVARDAKDWWLKPAAEVLLGDLPRWDEKAKTMDYYYWYYGALAMFQHGRGEGGDAWRRWNAACTKVLLDRQRGPNDACARGSWDPVDRWGFEGGRVCATALNALTLEVYYRVGDVFSIGKRMEVPMPPDVVAEQREKAAKELLDAGMQQARLKALATAQRLYREAAETYPETKSGKEAAVRLRGLGK